MGVNVPKDVAAEILKLLFKLLFNVDGHYPVYAKISAYFLLTGVL